MKTGVKTKVLAVIVAAAFAASACGIGASAPKAPAAATATPASAASTATTNTSALVALVLAQVDAQLAQHQAAVVVPVGTISSTVVTDSLQATLTSVYAQANPSVVYIETDSGSGSGFVYSDKGYILTNDHVVAGSSSINVTFADGTSQTADVVGTAVNNDLAVIKVASLPKGAKALTLAATTPVQGRGPVGAQVGQFVVAIGSPFGEQGSMSFGIVSGLGRTLQGQTNRRGFRTGPTLSNLIQTDAPINPGNSGGPLLNLDGQVIGINTAIESASGSSSGVGFAIPVNVIQQVVPGLIAGGG
jgi:S1-C subfamily serine protease